MSKRQNYNASITIGSVLENSVKRNIGVLTSGLDKVSNGIKDVERRQKELDKQRAMLRRQGQDVSHLDREYEDLERTLKDLRKAQERWNRAAAASTRVGANFRNMTSDMGRQMRRLSIGAVAAGGAIFGLAASTASLGDDVAKSADKLGFGIEGLQELRYAAERSGVATSTFDSSMLALTKRVGEAAQGFGAGKKALEQLGLKAEDMVKLAPEEQLALIAERLQDIEGPAAQAAVASGLFSRAGIGMVNMLRGGSDGLTQLREDAQRTGYVLSEKAARDAEVFQDTLLDTQLAVSGLKNTVGAALMPVVTTAMKQVGDAIIDNHESVEAWSEGFADSVENALPKAIELASGIGQIGSMVWDVVGATAEMVGGWENFGVVVGTVLAGKTLLTVAKFGTSVFSLGRAMFTLAAATPFVATGIRAIGAALIANPIGLTIAAIAGGAALIYKEWDNVGPWFGELWGGAQTYFSGFSDFVGGVFTGDMTRARSGLETAWDGFSSFHSTMWNGIGSTFKYGYENLIKPITDALGVTEPIEAAWTGTKVKIGEIFGAIGGFFSDNWETYVSPVITGLSSTESIGAAWEAAKAGLDPVLTWIGDKFAAVMAFISPVIDALKWTYENGTAAVGAVAGALGIGTTGPDLGKEASDNARAPGASGLDQGQQASVQAAQRARLRKLGVPEDKLPPIQKRALGGGFRPGWLLTGEAGPELKFESRAGYVANNRSMRQLAGYADRLGAFMEARSAQASAKSGRFTDTIKQLSAPPAGGTQQVVQHITNHIHAAGADAQELIRLLEERERRAAGNGLFDRTPALGEFGR